MNNDRTKRAEQLAELEQDEAAWRRYTVKASSMATIACLFMLLANSVKFAPGMLNIAISVTFSVITIAFASCGAYAYVMSRRARRAAAVLRGVRS